MLSIGRVATQGHAYYSESEYYLEGADDTSSAPSFWRGEGALRLGLSGPVTADVFDNLLKGQVPDGPLLGRMVDGERQHRTGYDLTFSAPKSVSILIEVLGESHVADLHDKAVRDALDYIEEHALETRVFDPGTGVQVTKRDQSMVAGVFRHSESRKGEAQIHSHAIIMNMVQDRRDGKWRSVESRELYSQMMLAGAVYRASLADQLRDIGFEIDRINIEGQFELRGMPKELMDKHSSRSKDIAEHLKDVMEPSAKDKARAALLTRVPKVTGQLTERRDTWKADAIAAGFDPAELVQDMMGVPVDLRVSLPRDILRQAKEILGERQSVFTKTDIATCAVQLSVGQWPANVVLDEIKEELSNGGLIPGTSAGYEKLLTTPEALRQERETIGLMREQQTGGKPLVLKDDLDGRLEGTHLSADQKKGVSHLLALGSRLVGLVGAAGVGKTTTLAEMRIQAEQEGYKILGLAPLSKARAGLEEAGIEAMTLQSFLQRQKAGQGSVDLSNTILFVDEASMLSTKQMHQLLSLTKASGAERIILGGDPQQLDSVAAGNPFKQMLDRGLSAYVMKEIRRQENPEDRAMVKAAFEGRIADAFSSVENRLVDVPKDQWAGYVAKIYCGLSAADRNATAVIAQTHAVREAITKEVRQNLRESGELGREFVQTHRLVASNKTLAERKRVETYETGQILRFGRRDDRLGIAPNSYWKVEGVSNETGTLRLSNGSKEIDWSPEAAGRQRAELYNPRRLEISIGDKLVWKRNDTVLGLVNSDALRVTDIAPDSIRVCAPNGRTLTIGLDEDSGHHFDYGWTSTVHAMQGLTQDNVILVLDAKNDRMTTEKAFYVGLSRMRLDVQIVTDDAEQLRDTLERNSGEKIAALDLVQEAEVHPDELVGTEVGTIETGTENDASIEPEIVCEPEARPVDVEPSKRDFSALGEVVDEVERELTKMPDRER